MKLPNNLNEQMMQSMKMDQKAVGNTGSEALRCRNAFMFSVIENIMIEEGGDLMPLLPFNLSS